jgi:hypothetical protein
VTEARFPNLERPPPRQEDEPNAGDSRSGTEFLSWAAGKLAEVWDYFDKPRRPTSADSIAPLHQLLQSIDTYVNTLAATTEELIDARESAREAAVAARISAETLEFTAVEWENREPGPPGTLGAVSKDYRALVTAQVDLKEWVGRLATRLKTLVEMLGGVSSNEAPPSFSGRRDQAPADIKDKRQRSHHQRWPRQVV